MSKYKLITCLSVAIIVVIAITMTATKSYSISFFSNLLSDEDDVVTNKKLSSKEELTKYDNWILSCVKLPNGTQKQCRVFQRVTAGKNKVPVLAVSFVAEKGKTISGMRIIAPLGVNLFSKLSMNIDKEKSVNIPYQLCQPRGCIVMVVVQDAFIKKIKNGNMMHVAYQLIGAKSAQKLDVPLKGFSKALEALEKEHKIKKVESDGKK